MKLTKLADKSESGWRTAIECEQDLLASGYEDDKLYRNLNVHRKTLKAKRVKFGLNLAFSTCL